VTEWKLFDGDVPYVSTFAFHEHRERAAHLEQAHHYDRLHTAARMVRAAAGPRATFSDLGCGDGGLLSLVQDGFEKAWGYDFQPSNAGGWKERGVTAYRKNVFGGDRHRITTGSVVAMTEVLEHLADPHETLDWLYGAGNTEILVCSSPVNENGSLHDECHAWAWDADGYAAMLTEAGFSIVEHEIVGPFQVVRAQR
jgi:hypothetical protein